MMNGFTCATMNRRSSSISSGDSFYLCPLIYLETMSYTLDYRWLLEQDHKLCEILFYQLDVNSAQYEYELESLYSEFW